MLPRFPASALLSTFVSPGKNTSRQQKGGCLATVYGTIIACACRIMMKSMKHAGPNGGHSSILRRNFGTAYARPATPGGEDADTLAFLDNVFAGRWMSSVGETGRRPQNVLPWAAPVIGVQEFARWGPQQLDTGQRCRLIPGRRQFGFIAWKCGSSYTGSQKSREPCYNDIFAASACQGRQSQRAYSLCK